jgi:colicin import membrane protein
MVRKLKTYQTSLGFYDLAIAAPSMKAALEAWGAGSNLFHQGVAKESGDPDVVAATMSKPGVVLRRPVGSNGPFREHADLPAHLAGDGPKHSPNKTIAKPKKQATRTTDDEAALAFEREQWSGPQRSGSPTKCKNTAKLSGRLASPLSVAHARRMRSRRTVYYC